MINPVATTTRLGSGPPACLVVQLRRVELIRTASIAEIRVDYDACDGCDSDHAATCGYVLALGMLPPDAEQTGTRYDAASREVQTFQW